MVSVNFTVNFVRIMIFVTSQTYSELRSMAVSLKQTEFRVSAVGLGATQAQTTSVRVPLPEERKAADALRKSRVGKCILPTVALPQAPLPPKRTAEHIVTAIMRSHTAPYRPLPPSGSVLLSASTFTVCNCHKRGEAEVFATSTRAVKHSVLPPQSALILPTPSQQSSSAPPPTLPSCPFALPTACAVVHDDFATRLFTSKAPGQHILNDSSPSLPSLGSVRIEDMPPPLQPFNSSSGFDDMDGAATNMIPPSAGSGIYTAFIPGGKSITLRLPPSVVDEIAVTIAFINTHSSHEIEVYWVDYDGNLVVRRVLM